MWKVMVYNNKTGTIYSEDYYKGFDDALALHDILWNKYWNDTEVSIELSQVPKERSFIDGSC